MSEKINEIPYGAFALKEDRRIRRVMERMKVFEWAAKEISRRRYEKYSRLTFAGGCIKCGSGAYPELEIMLQEICAALDLNKPELYVKLSPLPEAEIIGEESVMLVLSTGMLDLLTTQEMRCLIAHKVSHIHCGHEPFLMARALASSTADNLGILKGVIAPLRALLEEWVALAELSCDRGALIITQDMDSLQSMLAKLAGAGKDKFGGVTQQAMAEQYAHYEEIKKDTPLCPLFKTWSSLYLGIPHYVLRAGKLHDWVESGEYSDFLAGNYPDTPEDDVSEEDAKTYWGEFAGNQDSWQATGIDEDLLLNMPNIREHAQRLADTAQSLLKTGASFAGKALGAFAESLLKAAGEKGDTQK